MLKFLLFGYFLFFLSFPGGASKLKYIFTFALGLYSIFFSIKNCNLIVTKKYLGLFIWYIFILISILITHLNNFKIDIQIIYTYILTPILSFFISNLFIKRENFIILNKILIISFLFIIVLDTIYLLTRFNILPLNFLFRNEDIWGSFITRNNYIEARISNQSSLMFLIPYMMFINYYLKNKVIHLFLIMSLMITFLSGRRALQLSVCICFFIYIIYLFYKKKLIITRKLILYLFVNIIIIYISLEIIQNILMIDNIFSSIKNTILRAFSSLDKSRQIRNLQKIYLLNEWKDNIFLGKGISSYVLYYIRNLSYKWSYEEVYIAYLMQTGIIGASFFAYISIKGIYNLLLKSKKEDSYYWLGIALGSFSFFLCGSSNPMIYFIWFWSIFYIAYN